MYSRQLPFEFVARGTQSGGMANPDAAKPRFSHCPNAIRLSTHWAHWALRLPTQLFTTFHIGRQGAVHKENFYVGIPLTFSSISKIQRKYWKSFLQADIISFSGGAATKWSV